MPQITIPLRLKSVFSFSRRSQKDSSSPPMSILSVSTPVLPLPSPQEADRGTSFSPVESMSSTMVHFPPDVGATPTSSANSSPRVESRSIRVECSPKPPRPQAKVPYRSRSQMLPTRQHQQNAFEYIRVPTLPGVCFSLLAPFSSSGRDTDEAELI
ncbi:hypothetical protein CVT25_007301 [Psilocybe cyanescens]|uniref:Uncharacterized protein n=1 Tax=Psilocybe cyanescens TaxID=93625 RepID=A0A409XPF1_PSICY|nr:hypothetical protein CVT25_007301 [Psilocybe cyanescens]